MKKLLLIFGTVASVNAFAIVGDSEEASLASNISYCQQTGGKVIQLTANFNTNSGLQYGVIKKFCQYQYGTQPRISIDVVGLETLSKNSTLAATFVKSLVVDPQKTLPVSPYSNPSLNVCSILHGSEIAFIMDGGFANDAGEEDICVFGDGSSISAWSLIYAATNQRLKVKNAIRSEPLNINIPAIQ